MIPAISGALGQLNPSEWSVGSVGGIGSTQAPAGQAGAGSFSGALSNAVSSLEQTQANATQASQGLATGTLSDPDPGSDRSRERVAVDGSGCPDPRQARVG